MGYRKIPRPPKAGAAISACLRCRLLGALLLGALAWPLAGTAGAQVEFGAEDDLTVFGVDGTAADADVEIKGFSVFGATQSAYTGIAAGKGNVVVNGVLAVSSGAYFAGSSTFTAASKIYINDGSPGQLLSRNSDGSLQWASSGALGDNLGNHIATTTLNMAARDIVSVSTISVSSITTAGAGVVFSTNAYFMNGNVGIGTVTAQGVILNVQGYTSPANTDGKHIYLYSGNAGTGNQDGGSIFLMPGAKSGAGHTSGIVSVGISPATVAGATWLSQNSVYAAGYGYFQGGFISGNGQGMNWGTSSAGFTGSGSSNSTDYVSYRTNSVNRMHINGSGGIGMGTASPGANLHISSTTASVSQHMFRISTGAVNSDVFAVMGNGSVGISTGLPYAALDVVSTGTAQTQFAQIWRDGNGVIVGSMSATGVLMATKLIGATGSGDNLGNHTATEVLKMGAYGINTSSNITAASYQINGSTMVAILPGTDNIAYGVNAGSSTTGGSANTFVGNSAGASNTTGAGNTVSGWHAFYSNKTGVLNTATGESALYSNTTGRENTAYGYYTLFFNTTGDYNTAMGSNALYNNTTGTRNISLGYDSLKANTSGGYNVATGISALGSNITGGYNVAQGYSSVLFNLTGSVNTILGSYAGRGASGQSYSSSTIVGAYAGYSLGTGSSNLFVGYRAGYSVTTGTGNIIIGYNVEPSGATANNEINIGGVYKGLVSSGTATIGKLTVQAADTGITITSADYGKAITVNSASARTVTLPSVTAADIGATITVVKLGAGNVTIQAAASTYIADSASGGTIYNNTASQTFATITLRLVTSNKWVVIGGDGLWTTT